MKNICLHKTSSPVPAKKTKLENTEIALYFLGQAGFLIDSKKRRIIIDAYLSNTLAKKYEGKEFPHIRMISPPIEKENIFDVGYVFATHSHTDHTDNETLLCLEKNNPKCKFIIPHTSRQRLLDAGIKKENIISINAFDAVKLAEDITIYALPSAHEEIKIDENGNHFFLGFVIDIEAVKIYHSGDCIPYNGLVENLKNKNIDITLLPVNGRNKSLSESGILGNFTLNEACELSETIGAKYFLAHHYGMFDFNTINESEAIRFLKRRYKDNIKYNFLAEIGIKYLFKKD